MSGQGREYPDAQAESPLPWERAGWLRRRAAEALYTWLSVIPMAVTALLAALIYVAIWTTRPTADLQIAFIGALGIYAARRVTAPIAEGKAAQMQQGAGAKP